MYFQDFKSEQITYRAGQMAYLWADTILNLAGFSSFMKTYEVFPNLYCIFAFFL